MHSVVLLLVIPYLTILPTFQPQHVGRLSKPRTFYTRFEKGQFGIFQPARAPSGPTATPSVKDSKHKKPVGLAEQDGPLVPKFPLPVNEAGSLRKSSNGIIFPSVPSSTVGSVHSSDTCDTKVSPRLNVVNGFDFSTPDAQKVCGLFDPKQQSSWPWVASIGHKYSNETIEWVCLGSLITTEYILTTAHCLLRSPTVVAVGQAFVGVMTAHECKNVVISSIAESFQLNKYKYPIMYKNMGLVRLTPRVNVSSRVSPICFPFLAGVLDIIEFSGSDVQSLSFQFRATSETPASLAVQQLGIREYRVVNNTFCSTTAQRSRTCLKEKFPKGIRPEVMCITPSNGEESTVLEGAPLVLLDQASDSYVVIGISTGVSTCGVDQTNLWMYTRVNAFSSWVRENVGELPTPVPCYV